MPLRLWIGDLSLVTKPLKSMHVSQLLIHNCLLLQTGTYNQPELVNSISQQCKVIKA